MINHDKQQRLQGAIGVNAPRHDGELLTAAQFDKLTQVGQRDYLNQLDNRAMVAQARIVGEARGEGTFAIIAAWTQESAQ
jgi:hypothetical protein